MGNGVTTVTCDASNTINCSLSAGCAESLLYDSTTLAMVLAVMPTILTFGLVGNVAFLFVMTRVRSMRTVTNAYLTNLAVADILFLAVAVGDKLTRYLITPIPADQTHFGVAGCISLNLLQHLFNWVSIFLVTLVTLERYYGVCHPLKHMVLHTFSRTWKLIAGAWMLALVLSAVVVPIHYRILHLCIVWPEDSKYSGYPAALGQCAAVPGNDDWVGVFSNLFQTIPFFFAMAINCFAYTGIIRALKGRSGTIKLSREAILKNNRMCNQVSVMLIANGLSFFGCVAPFQLLCVASAISDLSGNNIGFGSFVHVARIMLYLNSAVNPYIYNVTNASYRQSFRDAFLGRASSRASAQRRYLSDSRARSGNGPSQDGNSVQMSRADVTGATY
ncbi:thyrotropin-releasing hormone receptor-like [Patiria miniata]|uniref:G-protein coupled receptors family 1 profile domain-containing protein n=1 Tax=Patiria miniata TaxID=46514 RepID=A0A913ZA88_PATMI|nr:thyrotropin-releasing hormone receptor-like [Patiria miniata]